MDTYEHAQDLRTYAEVREQLEQEHADNLERLKRDEITGVEFRMKFAEIENKIAAALHYAAKFDY